MALRYTYFHWGFNGWAMYAVMGGAMAYFSFRKGLPVLVSSTFTPVLGPDANNKPIGRLIDALAIVATLFGTATALGLNGLQLNSGLNYLLDVPKSNAVAVTIIVVVTRSSSSRRPPGSRRASTSWPTSAPSRRSACSSSSWWSAASTVLVISQGIESIGNYVLQVLPMSLQTGVGDEQWMAGWTIFYWAWWVSWAPFVGMFVARISRGRTIREFVIGVVAAPDRLRVPLVRDRRRHRHRAPAHRQGRHRRRRSPRPSCRSSPPSTCCRCPVDQLGALHRADRAVLHQRRRRRRRS